MSASSATAGAGGTAGQGAGGAAPPVPPPVAHDPDSPRIVSRNRPLLLVGAMAAMTMYTLDSTIANVALPHMSAALGATQDTVTWVLTSYVLASAVALPVAGFLVDTLGLRRMMLMAVALFTVASMACGAAQNIEQMVAFRIIQGFAGAFLSPLAQTVTLDSCTEAERPKMMAIYSQGIMLGPIAGPIVGGWLTDNLDWRWVFYVNLPVGVLCFLLLAIFLPSMPTERRRVDLVGWGLVVLTVSALQLILDRGQTVDWFASAEIVIYAVLAAGGGWLAFFHLSGAPNPLFPLALFRDRNFTIAMALMFLMGLVMMSVMAMLPGLLQQVYGYTALQSGLLVMPRGIGMLVTVTALAPIITRVDTRILLLAGLLLMGASTWMMTGWSIDMPRLPIVAAGLVQGFGLAFTFIPMNLIAFATLAPRFRTDAASMITLMRNLGSSIGIAISSVALSRSIQVNHAELGAHVTPAAVPFNLDRITAFGPAGEAALRMVDGMVNLQAVMISYINVFYAMGLACFIATPMLLLVRTAARRA